MANLFRLIAVLLVLLCYSVIANAEQCVSYVATYGGKTGRGSSASAAGSDLASKLNVPGTGVCPRGDFLQHIYAFKSASPGYIYLGHSVFRRTFTVTGSSSAGTRVETCVEDTVQHSDIQVVLGSAPVECAPPDKCQPLGGMPTGFPSMDFNVGPITTADLTGRMGKKGYGCFAGCQVQGTVSGGGIFAGSGVVTMSDTSFLPSSCSEDSTGSGSTPSGTTATLPAPPSKCSAGQCPGAVNGTEICVPCTVQSSTSSTSSSTTSTTGSGTSTTSSTTSGTKTSVTTCDTSTGQCSTTTTTQTSGGGSGQGGTTTEKKDSPIGDFCKENPKASMCKDAEDGKFSGACQGGFSCTGDAIQCAIAKEQHQRDCQFWESESDERALYSQEKGKTGNVTADNPNNSTFSIGPGSFNTNDAIGSGSGCIQNRTVSVMGWSGLLPFASICPYLSMLGNVLLTVSFLLAARIVTRG